MNEYQLLASNDHIRRKKVKGLYGIGRSRILCKDLLGDYKKLTEVKKLDFTLEMPMWRLPDNNCMITSFSLSNLHCAPMQYVIEGRKEGEEFKYTFTMEVPDLFSKRFEYTASLPLDFQN